LADRLRLYLTPGIGNQKLRQIRTAFQSMEHFIQALRQTPSPFPATLLAGLLKPTELTKRKLSEDFAAQSQGLHRVLYPEHPEYPEALRHIPDAPELLWVKGQVQALNAQPCIAIVGGRQCTELGRAIAQDFSRKLAQQGWTLVSGMAKGIDAFVHQGAIEAKGLTLGVLGAGVNHIYPKQNKALFAEVLEKGGALLSEYPMDTQPKPGHFPRRNRIISGLSRGVLVVEAAMKSGSLVTARLALEQGREVFAVPGAITNAMSEGCHRLIQEGAYLVTSVADITQSLSWLCGSTWPTPELEPLTFTTNSNLSGKLGLIPKPRAITPVMDGASASEINASEISQPDCHLSASAVTLLKSIGTEPVSIDDLVERLELDLSQLVPDLMELELAEVIENVGIGYRLKA
jgi:DNA processing protein